MPHRVDTDSHAAVTTCTELDHTYECAMSHKWTSHVIHNRQTIWKHRSRYIPSRITHMNELCHTRERIISHIIDNDSKASETTCTESCNTCEWVMPHTWMSHITHNRQRFEGIRHHCTMQGADHFRQPAATPAPRPQQHGGHRTVLHPNSMAKRTGNDSKEARHPQNSLSHPPLPHASALATQPPEPRPTHALSLRTPRLTRPHIPY